MAYQLTGNREEFRHHPGVKFSYGLEIIGDELHFQSHPLLSEDKVTAWPVRVSDWNGLPVFFWVDGPSHWPFDPFALSFYLVSRYEEYLPFGPDVHGRFSHEHSLAFRHHFLDLPLVDLIANKLKETLAARYPDISFPARHFRFIPTFDIDIAYAHLGKGWFRASLAWVKLLLKADFRQMKERFAVMTGKLPDPYDNFRLHLDLANDCGLALKYFVLLGDFNRYDRNVSHRSSRFRALLQQLSLVAEQGLHPSYRSHLHPEKLAVELNRLGKITGKPVTSSRFHFLRMKFPESFRMLTDAGIRDDYSMGYSTINGFRAGTCTPFYFYDLVREQATKLRIHPFIFMDSAMADHLQYTPEEAEREITALLEKVRVTGGEAIGIWHNYSLAEQGRYKGWQQVLINILKKYQTIPA